jgi:hypothetical protein
MSGRSRATPGPRKRRGRGLWPALIPLAGVVELSLHLWFAGRAPRFDDYAAAIPALDELRAEGDLVLMAPAWAEPALRSAAGDLRMPLSDVARADDEGHRHAVEVAILGARSEAHGGWREVDRREVGPFVLRRLENPRWTETIFDFVDHLHDETNAVAVPAGSCDAVLDAQPSAGGLFGHPTFPARRWLCPSGPFVHASVTVIADQRFRPRRCIWAHPPPQGELTITYRQVSLGDRIVGHGGLYWIIERERRGAPIELRVIVDGDEVGRYRHADGDGWSPFALPLGAHAGARAAEVTFAVSSVDWRHRHFCFEARTR